MNKGELITAIAKSSGLTKSDAERALNATTNVIKDTLASGEQVTLIGFGTFKVNERVARKGRNPQTGDEIDIPAAKVPAFKAGKNLKDAVNS
ncbi:HU family DNA-binding protein [Anaerolineales bacterium HSG24]|nr:HU family DNA-binding protein [Anaerolineales bacterium HSG24]